jgi:L-lysine exporter family protein LysE/ArgO
MNSSVFLAGLSVSLSLIVAIGAQNAFVLRQGLRNEHVLAVVTICALSDAILITLGVTAIGGIVLWAPWFDPVMRYGGACFLAWYGAKSLKSAFRSTSALAPDGTAGRAGLLPVMLTCLALTWLNPHVYLDTVFLIGAISTQFPGSGASFAAGAMTGSFVFFFALGYGAKRLRPIFARPSAWRALETVIALVMWSISLRLVSGA